AVLNGIGADKHGQVVMREFALRLVERLTVLRRQNDDRGKHDRAAADRGDLARKARGLARRTGDQNAQPIQAPGRRHWRTFALRAPVFALGAALRAHADRVRAASRARKSAPNSSPSATAISIVVTGAVRSPRKTRLPSRLAMSPRSQSWSPRVVA